MSRLLDLEVKKWYLRLALFHLAITVFYLLFFANFFFGDLVGFNLAFHGFYWFSYIAPRLFKIRIPTKNHRFLKIYLKGMAILFLLFGVIMVLVSLHHLWTQARQLTLIPISFAAVAPICASNFYQQAGSIEP